MSAFLVKIASYLRAAALGLLALGALIIPADLHAQGTLISIPTRRDMVFDHSGKYLYIGTSDGFIQRYNLSSGLVDASYNLGGSPAGIDIAPDDAYLLVAQGAVTASVGKFQKIDLNTGAITETTYSLTCCESGGGDVAIASNGSAFLTTNGWSPLRQIDLTSGSLTVRNDVANLRSAQIHRSADGTRLYFMEDGIDSGPVFTYTASTNSFSSPIDTGESLERGSSAVSRDGRLLATRSERDRVALDMAEQFEYLRSFDGIDSGVVFDPTRDVLYATSAAQGQIIAYNTTDFGERMRWTIGEYLGTVPMEQFGTGTLVASPNGKYLALATPTGIRLFVVPAVLPQPSPSPLTQDLSGRQGMVFNRTGQYLYVATVEGLVKRYNTGTGRVDASYNLGGTLRGIDIASDDSFLLVAQNYAGIARGMIHKVDLITGSVTNVTFPVDFGQTGAYDIAIAANGHAFVTLSSSWDLQPLLDVDLATNVVSRRNDLPNEWSLDTAMPIYRSADRRRLYFTGPLTTLGQTFTYDATANQFSRQAQLHEWLQLASGAVSRDGSLLATRFTYEEYHREVLTIDRAADFDFVHAFGRFDSGVVFDSIRDILYTIDSFADQVIALDTTTFAEKFRLDIGADLPGISMKFEVGSLVASPDGRFLAVALDITPPVTNNGIAVLSIPNPLPAPTPTPQPVLQGAQKLVFDHSGRYLYITAATGFVHRYNLQTGQLDRAYELGAMLEGADISPDDSYLLVAEVAYGLTQGAFYKLDLTTGAKTNVTYERFHWSERGAWDVAIGSNGLALATTDYGFTKLRQIDLATGVASIRTDFNAGIDAGDLHWDSQLQRSADGSHILVFESEISSGSVWLYDAATNSFGPRHSTNAYYRNPAAALNRDGTLLAISSGRDASLETTTDFASLQTLANFDSGLAFDASKDVLYGVESTTNDLVGYDTKTFAEVSRVDIGEDVQPGAEQFGNGTLVASQDGKYLALMTPLNILIFSGDPPAPPPSYTISVSASPSAGGTVTGGGDYRSGAAVNVTAAPSSGYQFNNWTENGSVLSTSANYQFIAASNRTLVANFGPVLPSVATPVISPTAGTFKKKVKVSLSCATFGAQIFYTLDGSDPTTSSPIYGNNAFKLKGKGLHVVKAKAIRSGYSDSAVAAAMFRIK